MDRAPQGRKELLEEPWSPGEPLRNMSSVHAVPAPTLFFVLQVDRNRVVLGKTLGSFFGTSLKVRGPHKNPRFCPVGTYSAESEAHFIAWGL